MGTITKSEKDTEFIIQADGIVDSSLTVNFDNRALEAKDELIKYLKRENDRLNKRIRLLQSSL